MKFFMCQPDTHNGFASLTNRTLTYFTVKCPRFPLPSQRSREEKDSGESQAPGNAAKPDGFSSTKAGVPSSSSANKTSIHIEYAITLPDVFHPQNSFFSAGNRSLYGVDVACVGTANGLLAVLVLASKTLIYAPGRDPQSVRAVLRGQCVRPDHQATHMYKEDDGVDAKDESLVSAHSMDTHPVSEAVSSTSAFVYCEAGRRDTKTNAGCGPLGVPREDTVVRHETDGCSSVRTRLDIPSTMTWMRNKPLIIVGYTSGRVEWYHVAIAETHNHPGRKGGTTSDGPMFASASMVPHNDSSGTASSLLAHGISSHPSSPVEKVFTNGMGGGVRMRRIASCVLRGSGALVTSDYFPVNGHVVMGGERGTYIFSSDRPERPIASLAGVGCNFLYCHPFQSLVGLLSYGWNTRTPYLATDAGTAYAAEEDEIKGQTLSGPCGCLLSILEWTEDQDGDSTRGVNGPVAGTNKGPSKGYSLASGTEGVGASPSVSATNAAGCLRLVLQRRLDTFFTRFGGGFLTFTWKFSFDLELVLCNAEEGYARVLRLVKDSQRGSASADSTVRDTPSVMSGLYSAASRQVYRWVHDQRLRLPLHSLLNVEYISAATAALPPEGVLSVDSSRKTCEGSATQARIPAARIPEAGMVRHSTPSSCPNSLFHSRVHWYATRDLDLVTPTHNEAYEHYMLNKVTAVPLRENMLASALLQSGPRLKAKLSDRHTTRPNLRRQALAGQRATALPTSIHALGRSAKVFIADDDTYKAPVKIGHGIYSNVVGMNLAGEVAVVPVEGEALTTWHDEGSVLVGLGATLCAADIVSIHDMERQMKDRQNAGFGLSAVDNLNALQKLKQPGSEDLVTFFSFVTTLEEVQLISSTGNIPSVMDVLQSKQAPSVERLMECGWMQSYHPTSLQSDGDAYDTRRLLLLHVLHWLPPAIPLGGPMVKADSLQGVERMVAVEVFHRRFAQAAAFLTPYQHLSPNYAFVVTLLQRRQTDVCVSMRETATHVKEAFMRSLSPWMLVVFLFLTSEAESGGLLAERLLGNERLPLWDRVAIAILLVPETPVLVESLRDTLWTSCSPVSALMLFHGISADTYPMMQEIVDTTGNFQLGACMYARIAVATNQPLFFSGSSPICASSSDQRTEARHGGRGFDTHAIRGGQPGNMVTPPHEIHGTPGMDTIGITSAMRSALSSGAGSHTWMLYDCALPPPPYSPSGRSGGRPQAPCGSADGDVATVGRTHLVDEETSLPWRWWAEAYRFFLDSEQLFVPRTLFDVACQRLQKAYLERADAGVNGEDSVAETRQKVDGFMVVRPAQAVPRDVFVKRPSPGHRSAPHASLLSSDIFSSAVSQDGVVEDDVSLKGPRWDGALLAPSTFGTLLSPLALQQTRCSICDRMISFRQHDVEKSYVWCAGCLHGGHAHHMQQWFSVHRTCPVFGCACRCDGGVNLY